MQPHEFYELWDGFQWRQEQQENMLAFFTCHLLNISGKSLKRPVSPKDLLKPLRQSTALKRDKKEDEAYLREIFKNALK